MSGAKVTINIYLIIMNSGETCGEYNRVVFRMRVYLECVYEISMGRKFEMT